MSKLDNRIQFLLCVIDVSICIDIYVCIYVYISLHMCGMFLWKAEKDTITNAFQKYYNY